jgi:predicted nucleic acid-binding Zn ribbon protein
MLEIRSCLLCGASFKAVNNRHVYCSAECKIDANKQRRKQGHRNNTRTASITIEQMIDTALRLSEERGKLVQYGDVQKELLTGKLIVKDGVIVDL